MSILQRLSSPDQSRDPALLPTIACRPAFLADVLETLSVPTRRAVLDTIDRLLRLHADSADLPETLDAVADRMLSLGLPLDRLTLFADGGAANAEAIECRWSRCIGRANLNVGRQPDSSGTGTGDIDQRSVLSCVDRAGRVTGTRRGGITQLLQVVLPLARGATGWLILMTEDPGGFVPMSRAIIEALVPSVAALVAMRVDQLVSRRLLRTYVGDGTHRAILSGIAERGQAIPIRSAILFADMRDSLGHTADIDSFQQIELLNDFFDCLVPPIEARGGEVLKFTGDGLLAIFPEQEDDDPVASEALDAAREAARNLATMNANRPTRRPIELGIGLHYGEAAYGNVGSGLRLDFTVVGRDIGLASRIGDLNKALSEPLLMSSCFADQLRERAEPVGDFSVAGLRSPVSVLRPVAEPPRPLSPSHFDRRSSADAQETSRRSQAGRDR
jgi:adenylate cyclase